MDCAAFFFRGCPAFCIFQAVCGNSLSTFAKSGVFFVTILKFYRNLIFVGICCYRSVTFQKDVRYAEHRLVEEVFNILR